MSVSFSWSKAGDAQASTQPTVGATPTVPVADQLQRVHDAWNPQSPNCAFQHYFYNRVPADQAARYVMPPGQDPQRWEQAMMTRPDPASVPVLAVGFTDLQKRVDLQNRQVNAYRVRMHEINDKLVELSNRHDLHTTVKLLEMRERHSKLARRALALAIRIQVLSNRGHVLSPQEELFQRMVRDLIKRADDPAVFGSLNEAWARIKSLKERQAGTPADGGSSSETAPDAATRSSSLDWDADREQLELIVKVLAAQQRGITFLAQLIEDDTQTVDEQLGLAPKKPKQKAVPATAVAPQAFAAQVPTQTAQPQPVQSQPQPVTQPMQPSQGGLFGQQAQGGQQAPSGGLFGQSKPGLFGSSQPSTGAAGQTAQPGAFGQKPSLFGSSQPGQTGQTGQLGGLSGQSKPLFGSQPGQSGLFGQANQNQSQPGQTSLFGGSQPGQTGQTGQTGGLFGGAQTSQPGQTGGLFGQSQQGQQGQAGQTGGGLFGQSQANQTSQPGQPGQSGGLFGQSQPKPGGLFGQSQGQSGSTGGLFGQNNQNQNQSTQPQTRLFGQANQSGQTSLFGQSNQTQPQQGGLFGGQSGQATGTQNSGSGLFGQSNQASRPGGLFGSSQPSTGSGLFGQSNQTNTFGNQTNNQSGTQGGLFGNTGAFGSSQPSQSAPPFGQSAGGIFGAR